MTNEEAIKNLAKGYLMFGQHSDVIAWVPLPEPYKAESEEYDRNESISCL